jgi:DnaJ-class molecular chaperone
VDSKRLSGYGAVLAELASPLDRLVAKSKIGGMIAERTDALRRAEAEVMKLNTSLGQLSTCPNCDGTGTKRRSEYERDDSRIQTRQFVDDCSLCNGKGTIDLG